MSFHNLDAVRQLLSQEKHRQEAAQLAVDEQKFHQKDINRQLRCLRERDRKGRQYGGHRISPNRHPRSAKFFCLLLYISEWSWLCAAAFIERRCFRITKIRMTFGAARKEAERLFMDIPIDMHENALHELVENPTSRDVCRVKRFFLQWKLTQFVLSCNNRNLAPDHRHLNDCLGKMCTRMSPDDPMRQYAMALTFPSARSRWKKFWRLGYNVLPNKPRMGLDVLRKRAFGVEQIWLVIWARTGAQKGGPNQASVFCVLYKHLS